MCKDSLGRSIFVTDTPGLSDIKTEEKAAKEIEKALKNPGKFMKINFVVGQDAGRVDVQDLLTINAVWFIVSV